MTVYNGAFNFAVDQFLKNPNSQTIGCNSAVKALYALPNRLQNQFMFL